MTDLIILSIKINYKIELLIFICQIKIYIFVINIFFSLIYMFLLYSNRYYYYFLCPSFLWNNFSIAYGIYKRSHDSADNKSTLRGGCVWLFWLLLRLVLLYFAIFSSFSFKIEKFYIKKKEFCANVLL